MFLYVSLVVSYYTVYHQTMTKGRKYVVKHMCESLSCRTGHWNGKVLTVTDIPRNVEWCWIEDRDRLSRWVLKRCIRPLKSIYKLKKYYENL